MVDAISAVMTAAPMGPIQTRLVADHEELDLLLERLIAAYETNDREIAACAYRDFEEALSAHFEAEERLLFPDFAHQEPEETNRLREDHRRIRARVEELGIGVDLHATRVGAIRELAQSLRAHAARENTLLYRWADRAFSDPAARARLGTGFVHGRSPVAPVHS
jgi:hemerythrin-like domain-containing protein